MKLIIGAGPGTVKQECIVRIDIVPEWADVVYDVEDGLPMHKRNGSVKGIYGMKFDEIEIHHVLEHIQTNKAFKRLFCDMYEVLNDGGVIDICVPYWKDDSAVDCYEHVRFFNESSFMNFYSNPYAKEMGLPTFEKVINEVRIHSNGSQEVHVILKKI